MLHSLSDTIAAIASPPGGAAQRGIVRLSGPATRQCLTRCFHAEPEFAWETVAAPTGDPRLDGVGRRNAAAAGRNLLLAGHA